MSSGKSTRGKSNPLFIYIFSVIYIYILERSLLQFEFQYLYMKFGKK